MRVLICGGGDGLAARDVLRFTQVSQIDLVDYNPEVLELGRTVFKPYNKGSLDDRVTVYTQEAFEFTSTLPDSCYHVVICDFTYPTCSEETSIYSREWFQLIHRILHPCGVICTNGVSPENRTTGFWCLYQTLLAAGLMAKPLHLAIPSFRRHGYGNWGFFLASPQFISRSELETISLPDNLQALTHEQLFQAFVFKSVIAHSRDSVMIYSLDCPQLFYYLLNPTSQLTVKKQENELSEKSDSESLIDFLEIQELGTGLMGVRDLLQLESAAQFWIEQIYLDPDRENSPDITQLLPVRHRYHSLKMTAEWLAYLKQLLAEVDVSLLLTSLLERAQELPPQLAHNLKQLAEKIRSREQLSKLPSNITEIFMMLSITLLMANLVTPDAVFAKGYSSSSSGHSSDVSSYDSNPDTKFAGFVLVTVGGVWLLKLRFSSSWQMNQVLLNGLNQSGLIVLELAVGFGLFWVGQLAYQKLFRRRMELNLELFVRDNSAVAIALVGYYFGIMIALGGVLGQSAASWQDKLLDLVTYGATVILFMLAGAWVGDRLILRCFECDREIIQERNVGAAAVEAGNHIADGLILNAALAGETGGWLVGLMCWLIGLGVLVLVSVVYPRITKYDVFGEIKKRNNPADGVALAGLLIATGNIMRVAFAAEYQNWLVSFTQYGLVLLFCLGLLVAIRALADFILVPGVKISDEIVHQEVPNLGAGLIEAFAYIAASFLIAWCFS